MACLSADEIHKPPGDPQDKPHPLKKFKNIKNKSSKNLLKFTRKSRHRGKNPIFGELLDFWTKNTMQKESIHLDLWLKSYNYLKCSVNSNEFE